MPKNRGYGDADERIAEYGCGAPPDSNETNPKNDEASATVVALEDIERS